MKPKRPVIFDMDGTLWDAADQIVESWNIVLEREKAARPPLTRAQLEPQLGKVMNKIAEALFPEVSEAESLRLLDLCCAYENEYLLEHGAVLYDGLEEVLKQLSREHDLFIVSNCQSGYIEAFLDHYGFRNYITDIECYGNNGKSKAENIRLLADRNGLVNPLYVGDTQGDYNACSEAGVPFLWAAYGFGSVDADVPQIAKITDLPGYLSKEE